MPKLATDTKFTVILNCLFVVFLDIVREIIYGNIIIFNIFHDLGFK